MGRRGFQKIEKEPTIQENRFIQFKRDARDSMETKECLFVLKVSKTPFLETEIRTVMYKSNVRPQRSKSLLKAYAKRLLRKSLIISFPQIAIAKGWRKKCLKIAIFVVCLIGAVYQTTQFLRLYFSYPTVFDIEVSRPAIIEQPAITFCNKNKRRRTVVCEKEECNCTYVLNNCPHFPPVCRMYLEEEEISKFYYKFPLTEDYLKPPCMELSWTAVNEESHTNKTIDQCKMFSVSMSEKLCREPYLRNSVREVNDPHELNNCYTIESTIGKANSEPIFHGNTFYVSIVLDTQHEEYLSYDLLPHMQVDIHDQKALINPYKDGTALKGGLRYTAYVGMTERRYLPAPYDTNCVDYLDQWRKRNGTGPVTQKACFEYCKLMSLKSKGECMDQNIIYPHEEKICAHGTKTLTEEIMKRCTKECGNPCREKTFEVQYEESGDFICGLQKKLYILNNCAHKFIYLEVSFSRYTLTILSYKPKYDSVAAFSYVGGYIGVWIGLSLVAVFDFLESMFHLGTYAIKQTKKSKANVFRQRIHRRVFVY